MSFFWYGEAPSKSQDTFTSLYTLRGSQEEEAVADIADSAFAHNIDTDALGGGAFLTGDSCPIQDLPIELLCLIFAESLCHNRYVWKYATTPVTLRQVCRQWESIICGLPTFWQSLTLHHHPIQDLVENVLENYFHFGKLGKLEADISLYGELENTYPLKRMKPLHIVRSNLQNFQSIVGRIHPTALHELFGKEYIYDMLAIRTLTLALKDSNCYADMFQPSLFRCSDSFQLATVKSLELYNFGYLLSHSNVKSSLPCLTRLFLKGDHPTYLLDHTTIFTILSVAFNLQEFSWTPGQDLGEGLLEELHLLESSSINLPKLTTLDINFQPFSADAAAVVCALHMPSLAEFHVSGCNLSMMNHEIYLYQMIEYFISTRGNSIHELALDNLLVNSEDWKRYIRLMPNLEKLCTDGHVLADGFFQYLTSDDLFSLRFSKLQYLTMFRRVFNDQELDAFVRFANDRGHHASSSATPYRQLKTMQLVSITWGGCGRAEFQKLVNEYGDLDWGENLIDLKPITAKTLIICPKFEFQRLIRKNWEPSTPKKRRAAASAPTDANGCNSPRALAMEIRFNGVQAQRKKTLKYTPTSSSWG